EDLECLAGAVPRFASMLLAPEGDPDAPDIPTLRSYAEAIMGSYSSQWQAAMDAEMASWKSTGAYVDEVLPPWANIVDGMWIFKVKRPPGSPLAFKARYDATGFSQQQWVDYFLTFSPTPKMTTLRVVPKHYSGTVIALPFRLQAFSASGTLWGGASTCVLQTLKVSEFLKHFTRLGNNFSFKTYGIPEVCVTLFWW
ncbi:unnamed protein product, partial [Closterium sp. NIES-53]